MVMFMEEPTDSQQRRQPAVGVRALETHVARWDTVAFRAYTSPEVTTSLQWHFRLNDTLPEPFYPNIGTGNVGHARDVHRRGRRRHRP
jgi:hypothetical protein